MIITFARDLKSLHRRTSEFVKAASLSPAPWVRMAQWILLLCVIALVILGFKRTLVDPEIVPLYYISICMLLFGFLIFPIVNYIIVEIYRRNVQDGVLITVEAEPDYLYWKAGNEQSLLAWPLVSWVKRTRSYLLFGLQRGMYFSIPLSAFEAPEVIVSVQAKLSTYVCTETTRFNGPSVEVAGSWPPQPVWNTEGNAELAKRIKGLRCQFYEGVGASGPISLEFVPSKRDLIYSHWKFGSLAIFANMFRSCAFTAAFLCLEILLVPEITSGLVAGIGGFGFFAICARLAFLNFNWVVKNYSEDSPWYLRNTVETDFSTIQIFTEYSYRSYECSGLRVIRNDKRGIYLRANDGFYLLIPTDRFTSIEHKQEVFSKLRESIVRGRRTVT